MAMAPPELAWWRLPLFLLIALLPTGILGNIEGNALNAFRQSLTDPSNVLQSWDPIVPNPCSWFHVTCNNDDLVTRVDLGSAGLSGNLVPQLGLLTNLQYLELYNNNLSGTIPAELGNLTSLVSLDLYQNDLSGIIPDSLGQLRNLQFLRMNNNSLSGPIPTSLTALSTLDQLNLSYNNLSGPVPNNGSFANYTPLSFVGNPNLCGSVVGKQCPGRGAPFSVSAPPPPPYQTSSTPQPFQSMLPGSTPKVLWGVLWTISHLGEAFLLLIWLMVL